MTTTAFVHGFSSTAMLIMAIGAQNAFSAAPGVCAVSMCCPWWRCAVVGCGAAAGGVWGMGGVLLARPEWGQWMRWAGALFLLAYALQTGARSTAAGPAAGDGGRAGQQPAQHGAHAAGPDLAQPHVYLDTVVLLGTMASPTHLGAGGSCHWRGRGQRAVVHCHRFWRTLAGATVRPRPRRGGCWMG